MTDLSQDQLSQLQRDVLDVVYHYPGRFSRSGLAKMLVGAKSWQDADFLDYGRFLPIAAKTSLTQLIFSCSKDFDTN